MLDGIRTRNPQIRSLVRYPLRHEHLMPQTGGLQTPRLVSALCRRGARWVATKPGGSPGEKKNFGKKICTTTERFELPRAEPNRFLIDRLNHSAKLPCGSRPPPAYLAAHRATERGPNKKLSARTSKNKKMPTAGIEPATFRSSV